jgi:hypothetical protein
MISNIQRKDMTVAIDGTDDSTRRSPREYSPPKLEKLGTIRAVRGGGNPGLDSNHLPAALSRS